MLDRVVYRGNDRLARAARLYRRRHDPDRVRVGLLDLSRRMQNVVSPVIGLVATLAPTIGPTVGGYLTDLYSWHWLFFVNILPGIAVTTVTWFLIDFDKPDFKLLEHFDWPGFLTMAGFLGALEYILEEGPTDNWFDSDAITAGTAVSAICGVLFFARVLTAKLPVVDLSAFKDRNFWTGSLFAFVLGVGLYGLTYLYPVYLARVRGYSALQIGETMFITGLACSSWRRSRPSS